MGAVLTLRNPSARYQDSVSLTSCSSVTATNCLLPRCFHRGVAEGGYFPSLLTNNGHAKARILAPVNGKPTRRVPRATDPESALVNDERAAATLGPSQFLRNLRRTSYPDSRCAP